jgi:hypothetical protein
MAAFAAMIVLVAGVASAQSTTPGAGIDVEIYFPGSGENFTCVAPGASFWAYVWVSPGSGSETCSLACSPPSVAGGSGHLATGIVDVAHDVAQLGFLAAEDNQATAAVDGLIQDHGSSGRVGWALAGDWTVDATPGSGLASPCTMGLLDVASWVYRIQYQATGTIGTTLLHLRRPTDAVPFALSFADICGSPAYKMSNGGIDEVRDAVVMISSQCGSLIYADSFGLGETSRWSAVVG